VFASLQYHTNCGFGVVKLSTVFSAVKPLPPRQCSSEPNMNACGGRLTAYLRLIARLPEPLTLLRTDIVEACDDWVCTHLLM
jgi:hypothetical protein